ncbi:probable enoyl-CoA hydratase 2, mitochondrial isoform X2 [Cryptomeria japonica]|uniref:probable enoyl-CoA hydratase 2, mitochondrial isoform X2 n=1 Tax=Cryptomeria japonica TaxID=3369 RepID=UPI0027D9DA5D|nr:probable enoyl-CoA hydratase 2, mitochondrial isoform X2 [Cryptomeria japonica]
MQAIGGRRYRTKPLDKGNGNGQNLPILSHPQVVNKLIEAEMHLALRRISRLSIANLESITKISASSLSSSSATCNNVVLTSSSSVEVYGAKWMRCYLHGLTEGKILHTPNGRDQIKNTQFRRALIQQVTAEPVTMRRFADSDTGIIEVTLDRPAAMNALGNDSVKCLQCILETLNEDDSVRAIMERRKMSAPEVKIFVNSLRSTFSLLEALSVPTIAVIEGVALGGGLELALSCDLRVCGDAAIFGMPETGLAIIPGAGGTQRLPRLIGKSQAKELIYTGRKVDGKQALAMGLVDHCVTAGDAYSKALEIARDINQKGPLAIKMAKVAIDRGSEVDTCSGMFIEETCYAEVLNSKDRLEGLAAFAEKRKPNYSGD